MPYFVKDGLHIIDNFKALKEILRDVVNDPDTGPTTLVIDALDECNESGLDDLINMINTEYTGERLESSRFKYLLTCRPYETITTKLQRLAKSFPKIRIPGEEKSEAISQEIECVIKYRVQELARDKTLEQSTRDHLEKRLLEVPNRTYLWIYLVFDHLRSPTLKKTKKGIDDRIDTLPKSVNSAYDKILSRSEDPEKVRKILCMILAATRPLTVAEMNVAFNIEFEPLMASFSSLDLEEEDGFKERLREQCGLFVSICKDQVYFLHQTAREYLLAKVRGPHCSWARSRVGGFN